MSVAGCTTPPHKPAAESQSSGASQSSQPQLLGEPSQAASSVAASGEPQTSNLLQPQVEVQPLSTQDSNSKAEPHIALLLPLKSAAFGRSAEAVQSGFLAAANSDRKTLPIKVYGSFDEGKDIVALYQAAISNGAVAVAGPLTRDGVTALAEQSQIVVPTLALNLVEQKGVEHKGAEPNGAEHKGSGQLYFFGLPMEAEARQVAQLAALAKLRYATIVSTITPLTKRLSQAFAAEWKELGGTVTAEILYNNDPAALALLPTSPGDTVPDPDAPPSIAPGNMIFLAADTDNARLIRPYINAALPVYATSQLFKGNGDTMVNYDLNDIHFVDMPWLLQPDHPAVMVYPRANPPLEPERERLYALGIDAFRLLQIMLSKNYRAALPLDGVTGRIYLTDDNQFQRVAVPAQIRQGRSQTLEPLPNSSMPLVSPEQRP